MTIEEELPNKVERILSYRFHYELIFTSAHRICFCVCFFSVIFAAFLLTAFYSFRKSDDTGYEVWRFNGAFRSSFICFAGGLCQVAGDLISALRMGVDGRGICNAA